jgi:hypothetical protein
MYDRPSARDLLPATPGQDQGARRDAARGRAPGCEMCAAASAAPEARARFAARWRSATHEVRRFAHGHRAGRGQVAKPLVFLGFTLIDQDRSFYQNDMAPLVKHAMAAEVSLAR